MTITKSQTEPFGAVERAQGRFLDTVGGTAVLINVGFVPRYFRWTDLTSLTQWEWFEGMANGTTLKTVIAGTRTLNTADVAISLDAGSGNQTGGAGTPDQTNAGVTNNVAYPGPSTIINNTSTQVPGTEASYVVTIGAAANVAGDQVTWVAEA